MSKSSRRILAENLNALMSAHPEIGTEKALRLRSGLGGGTIDGARRGTSATTVDSLDKLARAFGLEAYQLLIPDLDPRNPPTADLPRNHRAFYERLSRQMQQMQQEIADFAVQPKKR